MLRFKKYLTLCLCLVMLITALVACADNALPEAETIETSATTTTAVKKQKKDSHKHSFGELQLDGENVEAPCDSKQYYKVCEDCQEIVFVQGTHKLVMHPAKPASCTEFGWDAYETCTECDYTTYQEIVVEHIYGFNETCVSCGAVRVIYVESIEITNEGQKTNEVQGNYIVLHLDENGETRVQIEYVVNFGDATNTDVVFEYEEVEGVTVDENGLVTFTKPGVIRIRVVAADGNGAQDSLLIIAK